MAGISLNFMMIFLVILPFTIAIIIFGFKKWLKNFAGEIGAATMIAVVALTASLNYVLKSKLVVLGLILRNILTQGSLNMYRMFLSH